MRKRNHFLHLHIHLQRDKKKKKRIKYEREAIESGMCEEFLFTTNI